MEATDKEKLLAKHLDVYIKDRHTQEECIGFIDGFKEALKQGQSLPLDSVSKRDCVKKPSSWCRGGKFDINGRYQE